MEANGKRSLRERLAELEHIQWALWTKHMLDNMDEVHVANWRRQIATPYADLSEKEKDSDREWADKVIAVLEESDVVRHERPDPVLILVLVTLLIFFLILITSLVWGMIISLV